MHTSIKLDTPCEFINVTPINPLISKCQIKVCYVGETPNRNRSVITKDVATQIANSLPGSPIVGFYNETNEDFEEHNRIIDISNGQFKIKDVTKPYGFVDLNAKVWFQKYRDDDEVEREYLVTEGYLWTGQYPEAKRIIEHGNNQSMELDEKTINASWTKDSNGKPQFFIINEAIISKLCILGEDYEPCFEGSSITKFSFEDDFKQQIYSMMAEIKEILEGGTQVFTTYAVEIGDALWSALYSYIEKNYPDGENRWCSKYSIDGIFEENSQKFAVLKSRNDLKYYRLDFSISDADGLVISGDLVEVTKSYTPAENPQFALADVEAFEVEYKKAAEEEEKKKAEENEDKEDKSKDSKSEDKEEGDKSEYGKCSGNKKEDDDDEECKKKAKYSLEEIPEYVELSTKYSELETQYSQIVSEKEKLEAQIAELTNFKVAAERKEKEDLINNTFYMLSEEDKADVIKNIDNYSLHDIESELSILCVRNKVSFAALEDNTDNNAKPVVYNLSNNADSDDSTPAWVKAVLDTAKAKTL